MKKFFKNRIVLGIFAIIMGFIITFGLTPLYNSALQAKVDIIRVTKDINKGDLITKEMVQIISVGGYNLPDNVLKTDDDVVGKYANAFMGKGDYILDNKVSNEPLTEHAYLYSLDGKQMAISITIKNFAAGLSGKLEAGDIVSVIISKKVEQNGDQTATQESMSIIPKELQFVQVLAVTDNSGYDKTYEPKDSTEEKELPSTVTLLATATQAKTLASLEDAYVIHLGLVYRGNEAGKKTFLDQQNAILEVIDSIPETTDGLTSTDGTQTTQVVEKPKNEGVVPQTNTTGGGINGQ